MSLAWQGRRLLRGLVRQGGRVLPAGTWAGDRARRLMARFVPDVPLGPSERRARAAVDHFLQDPRAVLAFPPSRSPEVSTALVIRGRPDCAFRCLQSLLAHETEDGELIVVNSGLSEDAVELLARLRNATVVDQGARRDGAGAWMRAAEQARAGLLLLLDPCWAPAPGAVAAMRHAIETQSGCGAVTGPMVRADGTLHQAGGIAWRDGALQHYGHGGNLAEAQFSYPREVDHGSAAFMMVRTALFVDLGGFDEALEGDAELLSADLGMAIRRRGHRVLYEPRAAAFHCGHPGSRRHPAWRPAGRAFVEKWRLELEGQPEPRPASTLRARDRARGPRVLVVDDSIPDASRGAGYPRAHALLTMLASLDYRVTFFPYLYRTRHQPWLHDLQRAGVEVMAEDVDFEAFCAARSGLYDAVVASRPGNFREVRLPVRRFFPRAALIYDAEALFFLRDKLKAELAGEPWSENGLESEERALLRQADLVVAVSEHDRKLMAAGAPELQGRVRTWGHPVPALPTTTCHRSRCDLLFVGGFQARPSPNEDAVRWFVLEVLPLVRSRIDCRLKVVGFGAREAVGDAAGEGVDVLGYEEDLTGRYESCRVFVVPHLYAAGIPLKLCEAMARGVPAVVTDLIARQLGAEPGREVLVGRSAREFADKVVELWQSETLWTALRDNGLAFVRERHDPGRLRSDLDAIVKGALSAVRERAARSDPTHKRG